MENTIIGGAWGFRERLPEANIQAEFYHCCRLLEIPCVLEYRTPTGRHDVAIFSRNFDYLLAIVECKCSQAACDYPSRQMMRYRRVGVRIYTLCSLAGASALAAQILNTHLLRESPNVAVQDLDKVVPLLRRGSRKRRKGVVYAELDPDLIIRS